MPQAATATKQRTTKAAPPPQQIQTRTRTPRAEIGSDQRELLGAMGEHGAWHPTAAKWKWRANSTTLRVMKGLMNRGYVEPTFKPGTKTADRETAPREWYGLTAEGKKAAKAAAKTATA